MEKFKQAIIDLHIHSSCSDGTYTAIELLQMAEKQQLDVISITDHNTVDAYKQLATIDVSKYYSGKIITGIELNTKVLGIPIEILGYGIDYIKMDALLKEVYISNIERNVIEVKRLYEKCINAGIKLDSDCLSRYDPKLYASTFILSEIVKYDVNKSIISLSNWNDGRSFYRKYMSDPTGILYMNMNGVVPDFNTAASLIEQAGGLVFLPHIFEYRENSEKILAYILENYGVDGMECYYTTFTPEETKKVLNICKENHLYMSGGSDYHGSYKPNIELGVGYGDLSIKGDIIEPWISYIRN